MDRTEPFELIDNRLFCDLNDHRELAAFISAACQAPAIFDTPRALSSGSS